MKLPFQVNFCAASAESEVRLVAASVDVDGLDIQQRL